MAQDCETGRMTTTELTPEASARHRVSWISAALTIALIPAGIAVDYVAPMEPILSLIAHFTALWTAIATALCTGNRGLKRAAWILAPFCWILSLYDWFGYVWTGSELALSGSVATAIFYVLMAMPPAWLLLATGERTRSEVNSFLPEAGALVILAMALFILTIDISTRVEPASPAGWLALLYAAAAGLLLLAAWRRPSRRVAYGFVALLLAAVAAGSHWLFYSEDPDTAPIGFIGIEVFAPGALIVVPAIAATLQASWTAWRKTRPAVDSS